MTACSSSRIFSSSAFGANLHLHNKIRANTSPKQSLQVIRASQGFKDHQEGRRSRRNHEIDDANLRLLKERVEVIKARDRLERLFVVHQNNNIHQEIAGWTYNKHVQVHKKRKQHFNDNFVEMLMIVCGNFGFTIAGGTLCLCLASVLVHYAT